VLRTPVFSQAKESVGDVDLPGEIFGAPLRSHLLYESVKSQLANRRAGTAATKTRAFVSGGGKKPWKQKGTGRARQGSTRATQWVGGATVFGPQPRDYSYRLPRTARRQALCSALSAKLREGRLLVVDRLDVPSGKTKDMVKLLTGLGFAPARASRDLPEGGFVSALIVVREASPELSRAVRNLPRAKVIAAEGVNVSDVLRYERVVLTRDGLDALTERLGS
jgi:large subunit ribosomal protein L4